MFILLMPALYFLTGLNMTLNQDLELKTCYLIDCHVQDLRGKASQSKTLIIKDCQILKAM